MTSMLSTRSMCARVMLALLATACLPAAVARSAAQRPVARKATTSRAARLDARRSIPLDRLSARDRTAVEFVLDNTTIYRRMPTAVIDCDPHLYLLMIRHPEVIANIWNVMGISDASIVRTGDKTFRASDGAGSQGVVKVVHEAFDKHIVYCEGSYDGPLVKRPVRAKCVLSLRSGYIRETNGRYYVTCRLDGFIHLDRAGVSLLAKTFQSLIGRSADYNFTETMGFVGSVSRSAERNPRGVARMAQKLEQVNPEVRNQLVTLSQKFADRSAKDRALRRVRHEAIIQANRGRGR